MANWSNPLLTSTYTNFVTEVKDRDTDLALQFDGTTSTNIPTNTIRWNSSANRWQKWNGSSWGELTSLYALTGLSTTGNAVIGGTVSGASFTTTANTAPTNGVYLPNANTVGIATNSTGRIFVDASGRFGVGTSTPGTAVDVTASAGSATLGNIRISPSTPGQARFHLFNGGATAEWLFGQKTSTDHDFKLSKSVAGSESDCLTVNTSGSVGIGTTSPGSLLDVNGAITARGDGSNVALYMPGSTALRNTGTATTTYLDLATGGASHGAFVVRSSNAYAERFRIDSSGRVGIETSAPNSPLHVIGTLTPITAQASSTDVYVRLVNSVDANGYIGYQSNALTFWTTNTERLRIDSNGRVSLGTASASTSLEVQLPAASATSGNVYVVPSTAGQARYRLYNGGATAEWIFGQKTSTDHNFKLSKLVAGNENDYLAVTTAGVLQFDSGYGSNANAYGCRAWANINAGATPSIRASGNVSSVTDAGSGVGDFLVSFTTAMPDANYAAVVTAGGAGTLASANAAVGWAAVYAAGSVRIGVSDNNTDTNVDIDYLNVAIFR